MAEQPVRIQLVDDHEVVRAGFRHLLEQESHMQVVGESATGKHACRDYQAWRPDLVILDLSLPDISGLEVMRRILLVHAQARILILSMHGGMVAERAMEMGARGFISKRSGARLLLAAIERIMTGGCYLDGEPDVQVRKQASEPSRPLSSPLTRRELEICMLLAEGRSVKKIAAALHVSAKTIYTHRQHIMDKLGVATAIELSRVASRIGIAG